MSIEIPISPIDYEYCSYTGCALQFRGPQVDLSRPFMAVLGSSEMHGRFVPEPIPDLLGSALGAPVANFAVHNAGLDAFTEENSIIEFLLNAPVVVLQVMGAQNMSNRFYTVHPRRNDRFLRHSRAMQRLFKDVDFSDFVFTRHMMQVLSAQGEVCFGELLVEMEKAWIARMERVLDRIPGKVVLVSIQNSQSSDLGPEPLYVSEMMIDAIRDRVVEHVECDITTCLSEAQLEEMVFAPEERDAAFYSLPPLAHEVVARALVPVLKPLWDERADPSQKGGGQQSVA